MNPDGESDSLSLPVHAKIGRLRERFEDSYRNSLCPRIEEYLSQVGDIHRAVLFRELLQLELDYQAIAGKQLEREEYLCRFPEYREVIERVFQNTRPQEKDAHSQRNLSDGLPHFGPYISTRELGRGGFGTVYLATHNETGNQVAIKVGTRLLHEAKTLLSLKHPSIIRVLHVGRDVKNQPYLVMDYMQGGSLRDRIGDEDCPLTIEEAVEIAERISEALHTAHSHRPPIYHRDLKPENVLFDEDDNVCVTDFGLALTEANGQRGDFSGTLPYQSPEQVRGEADWLDARNDVWAVGIILYEMLTACRPFAGTNLREQILHKNPKSPRQINDRIPESLEAICMKCLQKDVKDRYQTADSLARALRNQERGINPYVGLESFEEADADRFYGRNDQIQRLYNEFFRIYVESLSNDPKPRVFALLGPSGCGKSSLAKAGLVPALRRNQFPERKDNRVKIIRPRTRPLKSLADALDGLAEGSEEAGVSRSRKFVRDMNQTSESGQYDGLWWIVDSLPNVSDSPIIIVLDQFEELFTECEDNEERNIFIENVLYASSHKDGAFSVVITLRSDFLPETQQHGRLNEIISNQGFLIPAMTEAELREAITEPAKKAGYEFDNAIADLLVNDSYNRDGALPLLQMALTRIWDGLRRDVCPTETYRQFGGVGGALAKAADGVFENLSKEEQQIARRIFLGLIKLGEGTQDTRRTAEVVQILSHKDDRRVARAVLSKFSSKDSRFITLKRQTGTGLNQPDRILAELTHEALLEHWQRLRSWLDASRSRIRFRDRLDDAARRWDELGYPDGSLWRPPELELLRQQRLELEDDLTQIQKAFCDASEGYDKKLIAREHDRRKQEEEQQRRESARQRREVRILRLAAVLFSVLLLVCISATFVAIKNKSESERQRIAADEQRAAANNERSIAEVARDQAQSLASMTASKVGALRLRGQVADVRPDQLGLLEIASSCRIAPPEDLSRYRDLWAAWYSQIANRLVHVVGHESSVVDASVSPDGIYFATASENGSARVWNLSTGRPSSPLLVHDSRINQVLFSPNSSFLASSSIDGKVKIWKLGSFTLPATELEHEAEVISMSFSPSGKHIVTGTKNGKAIIWDVSTGQQELQLIDRSAEVYCAKYSPNGEHIATISYVEEDDYVRSDANHVVIGHSSVSGRRAVTNVQIDTSRIAGQSVVQLWHSGEPVNGYKQVGKAKILHKSKRYQTEGRVPELCLFDQKDVTENTVLIGHELDVLQLDFFNEQSDKSISQEMNIVLSLGISREGNRLAIGTGNATLRVMERAEDNNWSSRVNEQMDGAVEALSFSPDGEVLATGTRNKTLQLWDVGTAPTYLRRRGLRMPHLGAVVRVMFSKSGRYAISAARDATARVWDTTPGIDNRLAHSAAVNDLEITSDNAKIVTGCSNGFIRIWDAVTGEQLVSRKIHSGAIEDVCANQDGSIVVAGCDSAITYVWDATSQNVLKIDADVPEHPDASVIKVKMSRDGTKLATRRKDGITQIWDTRTGKPLSDPIFNEYERGERTLYRNLMEFNQDSTVFACASLSSMRIFALSADFFSEERVLTADGQISAAYFSILPEGQEMLVTASWPGLVRRWEFTSGDEIARPIVHGMGVMCASVSQDGRWCVTGSDAPDQSLRVWDLWDLDSALPACGPIRYGSFLTDVQISEDGMVVAGVGMSDESVTIWQRPTALPMGDFSIRGRTAAHAAKSIYRLSQDGTLVVVRAIGDVIVSKMRTDWTDKNDGGRNDIVMRTELELCAQGGEKVKCLSWREWQEIRSNLVESDPSFPVTISAYDPEWHRFQAAQYKSAAKWRPALRHLKSVETDERTAADWFEITRLEHQLGILKNSDDALRKLVDVMREPAFSEPSDRILVADLVMRLVNHAEDSELAVEAKAAADELVGYSDIEPITMVGSLFDELKLHVLVKGELEANKALTPDQLGRALEIAQLLDQGSSLSDKEIKVLLWRLVCRRDWSEKTYGWVQKRSRSRSRLARTRARTSARLSSRCLELATMYRLREQTESLRSVRVLRDVERTVFSNPSLAAVGLKVREAIPLVAGYVFAVMSDTQRGTIQRERLMRAKGWVEQNEESIRRTDFGLDVITDLIQEAEEYLKAIEPRPDVSKPANGESAIGYSGL